jgi:adenine/guanine phosphoribosyltransferase-like PRPP-binding protein
VQAGLSNHARRQNVMKAFRARPVQGKRILLIDDVMTTGATATACALALKRAGAARVALLTVARADRRLPDARLVPDKLIPYKSMVGENSDHAE